MKTSQRMLCFLLCAVMVLQMVPSSFLMEVFAAKPDNEETLVHTDMVAAPVLLTVGGAGSGHTHQQETAWSSDGITHWYACQGCEELLEQGPHYWVADGSGYKCRECGKTDTVTDSGSIGSNLWFKMLSGGAMIIGGTGAMKDYSGGNYNDDPDDNVAAEDLEPKPYSAGDSIQFMEGVTSISDAAFYSSIVQYLTFPSTLEYIGNWAFADCIYLKEAHLPEGLTDMGKDAFGYCISLTSIYIPSTLKVIPTGAFSAARHLEELIISEGVEEIGMSAFGECSNLHSHYDEGLVGLEYVKLPSTLKVIGETAFAHATMLRSIEFPEGLEYIGFGAFTDCPLLQEVTIPASVKYVGGMAFLVRELDIGPDTIPMLYEQPLGLANLYILNPDVELAYSTSHEDGDELCNITNPDTLIHGYKGSTAESLVKYVNAGEYLWAEGAGEMTFISLTDGDHHFGDRVSMDDTQHHRVCTDAGCDAEEVAPHTLRVDRETIVAASCTTDGSYRWICTACDYAEAVQVIPAEGHDVDYSYWEERDEDYHYITCWRCEEVLSVEHTWEYQEDDQATEPYEVEARCAVCKIQKVITVQPVPMDQRLALRILSQNQQGETTALTEGFSVQWLDKDDNALVYDNVVVYKHTADWAVSEENPVRAVLTFDSSLRKSHIVPETAEYRFTELGTTQTVTLTQRPQLTIKGTMLTPDATIQASYTLGGTEHTQQVDPGYDGSFEVTLYQSPITITISAYNHETAVFRDVQLIPADMNGVIDLGEIKLETINNMAREYLTVPYGMDTYQYEAAAKLAGYGKMYLENNTTGEVYNNVMLSYHYDEDQVESGQRSFSLKLGMDSVEYFKPGDSVTLKYDTTVSSKFGLEPYTFTIAEEGNQTPLDLIFFGQAHVQIRGYTGHVFVFDESGALVSNQVNLYLDEGQYTLISFRKNSFIHSISYPDELADLGVDAKYYTKKTFTVGNQNLKIEIATPEFIQINQVGMSFAVGESQRVGELIPVYFQYNMDISQELLDQVGGVTFRLDKYYSYGGELPFAKINGKYAFTADEGLTIQETLKAESNVRSMQLSLHVNKVQGTIVLYARPTGDKVDCIVSSAVNGGNASFRLPENRIELTAPGTVVFDAQGTLHLYAGLGKQGYRYRLYVNGALQKEGNLSSVGYAENVLPYTLNSYDDGVSGQTLQVEVADDKNNVIWTSPLHQVTLIPSEAYPQPISMTTRYLRFSSGIYYTKTADFVSGKIGSTQVTIYPHHFNPDNTVNVDFVYDYQLKMSSPAAVKDQVVLMKVFCGENLPAPTIHTVKLNWNPETMTFDGTLTLAAGTFTIDDLPYGYSFVYSAGREERYAVSMDAVEDSLDGKWDEILGRGSQEALRRIDTEKLEFNLQNQELTDGERELLRLFASVENGMADRTEAIARKMGEVSWDQMDLDDMTSQDLLTMDGKNKFRDSMGITSNTESIDGITAAELADMGYRAMDVDGKKLYVRLDQETGDTSVVDLEEGVHTYMGSNPMTHSNPVYYSDGTYSSDSATLLADITRWTTKALEMTFALTEGLAMLVEETAEWSRMQETAALEMIRTQIGANATRTECIDYAKALLEKYNTGDGKVVLSETDRLNLQIFALTEALDDLTLEVKQLAQEAKMLRQEADFAAAKQWLNRLSGNIIKFMDSIPGVVFGWTTDMLAIIVDCYAVMDYWEEAQRKMDNINMRLNWSWGCYENAARASNSTCLEDPDAAYRQVVACRNAHDALYGDAEELKVAIFSTLLQKIGVVIGDMVSIGTSMFVHVPQISMAIDLTAWAALNVWEAANVAAVGHQELDMDEAETEVEKACIDSLNNPNGPFRKDEDCDEGSGSEDNDCPNNDCDGDGIPDDEEDDDGDGDGDPDHRDPNKPIVDPAGYVYEAVASNRIEGATAKIYYRGADGSEVYWAEAADYEQINPQITDAEGRFSWMTPVGGWLVKVEKEGYLPADSRNDPAAVDGWLPVPPPQMDVNIAMISTAAPTVESVQVASDQIQVVFSQYMDIAQFESEKLVTVTQNGLEIPVTLTFTDAEESPTKAGVFYGRILKLTPSGTLSGDGFTVQISGGARNYAGTAIGSDCKAENLKVVQILGSLTHIYPNRFVTDVSAVENVVVVALDTAGNPMPGVKVSAKQQLGGTLEISASAVTDENGRATFSVKGVASGFDVVTFSSGLVSVDMNTRVSPVGSVAPKKPTANLTDYQIVEAGTQLILECATEGAVIYYTTNNTCPCTDSPERKVYTGPITITEDTLFRIASWTASGGYSERLNLRIRVESSVVIGDISGDGKVNGVDLILLRQYLAGWDVTIDERAADTHADGNVNGLDLILLRQYLAGWDVTLG